MPSTTQPDNPVAIGLMLCDQVIVDKDTGKPSPVGIFTGLAVDHFDEPQTLFCFRCPDQWAWSQQAGIGRIPAGQWRPDLCADVFDFFS
jgi:hypothetical protein